MSWTWTPEPLARLAGFLAEHELAHGPLTTRSIGDGHSNLTFLVSDGETEVVVRRPPPPPTPRGAHDVLREARVIAALTGTGVPAPRVLATAEAGAVLDVPFYVMSYLPGAVITDRTPGAFDPAQRRFIAETMVDTLADLHAVDWRACGLEGFGRPEGFNLRHLGRVASLIATDGDLPPDFAELHAWLRDNAPEEAGASIVHNDYRIGNLMWSAEAPVRLLAVLDWELATLGDPLLDVGYFLASYPDPGDHLTPTQELARAVLEPGYPRRDLLAERYAARTGRSMACLNWYMTMAQWKLAILYEHSRRAGVDSYYSDAGLVSRFLAAASLSAAKSS